MDVNPVLKALNELGEEKSKSLGEELEARIKEIENDLYKLSEDTKEVFGENGIHVDEILHYLLDRKKSFINNQGYQFNETQKGILLYKAILGEKVSLSAKLPHEEKKLDQNLCDDISIDLSKLVDITKHHTKLFREVRNALYDKRYKEQEAKKG
jgi:hypothetical protein